ncbi:hypothetical protein TWF225_005130 [Orbilia oligospora]|uniref:Uncharacterized protein n=1 Tax=Orbilia oligospora TaxID=2813651 RepID=A0A7C8PXR4_ORBOL|nr:hypothetical protein TWF751_004167 [Orbilia oligospora]KAF3185748.1 hypothetical protein TWF225_005130 [Orbilia oligospora]KAF3241520.1 hypothetical protein TWF128_011007 [Orbilia oligospora]KAF3249324.1 hypothetical protein TWF217_008921 [Orbilia oligospora]KAF3296399.1 hypothetical protein TWF132_010993 [Orbilia oligospora]
MKGVKVDEVNGEYQVTDDLEKPVPDSNQLLAKPIFGAVNPVDELMRNSGILITSWPWTPCCDVAGIVVEVGSEATKFKVGDRVFGCQGVGFPGSGGAAEYCLFRDDIALKKPDHISLVEAATMGVGSQTAALGLWSGLNIALPDPQNLPAISDEWVLVLGGGGSVGGYAVQLSKLSGYRVIASVSARSVGAAFTHGADETVDYKTPIDEQIAKIKEITKGKLHRIIDTTAYNASFVKKVLEEIKDDAGEKYFASVNDWEDFGPLPGGAKFYPIALGTLGRPESKELNEILFKYIDVLQAFVDVGKVKPSEYNLVGGTGFESFIEAVKVQSGGSAKKVVAKLQEE